MVWAIGKSEIRRKTVKGFKSEYRTLNGFGLARRAWSGRSWARGCGATGETRPEMTSRFWDSYGVRENFPRMREFCYHASVWRGNPRRDKTKGFGEWRFQI